MHVVTPSVLSRLCRVDVAGDPFLLWVLKHDDQRLDVHPFGRHRAGSEGLELGDALLGHAASPSVGIAGAAARCRSLVRIRSAMSRALVFVNMPTITVAMSSAVSVG